MSSFDINHILMTVEWGYADSNAFSLDIIHKTRVPSLNRNRTYGKVRRKKVRHGIRIVSVVRFSPSVLIITVIGCVNPGMATFRIEELSKLSKI